MLQIFNINFLNADYFDHFLIISLTLQPQGALRYYILAVYDANTSEILTLAELKRVNSNKFEFLSWEIIEV